MIGKRPKIRVGLLFVNGKGLEEQRLSAHLHIRFGHFPVSASDISLLDAKCAALVEVSEDATPKLNFREQLAVDLGEALLPGATNITPSMW